MMEMIYDAVSVFKALGDKTRFDIVNLLSQNDSYVELLADKLKLTAGTVSFHLKKLEQSGLVTCSRTQYYMIYSLNRAIFEKPLSSFLSPPENPEGDIRYKQKVIDSFFENGRLKCIPSQLKKREIVCEYIAQEFERDRDYPEAEINAAIQKYHDDFCTLRRELIALKLMERKNGFYHRIK